MQQNEVRKDIKRNIQTTSTHKYFFLLIYF